MAYGDPEAPDDGSNDGSSGGDPVGSQEGNAPSAGPGTGRNPDNPARGVSFDAPNLSGLMGGLRGMLGFESSSPVTGVNVETEATRTHPDEGLFGIQSSTLTSPGYTKAVGVKEFESPNQMRHRHNLEQYGKKAQSLREQLAKEKAKTKKDYGRIRDLTSALQAIERSPQYSKHMAMLNPALGYGAKALSALLGLGPLSFAQSIENRAIELGFVDDTTPEQTIEAAMVDGGPSLFGSTSDGPLIIEDEEVAPLKLPMALQLLEGQPE
jgi:hypothetical protein